MQSKKGYLGKTGGVITTHGGPGAFGVVGKKYIRQIV